MIRPIYLDANNVGQIDGGSLGPMADGGLLESLTLIIETTDGDSVLGLGLASHSMAAVPVSMAAFEAQVARALTPPGGIKFGDLGGSASNVLLPLWQRVSRGEDFLWVLFDSTAGISGTLAGSCWVQYRPK